MFQVLVQKTCLQFLNTSRKEQVFQPGERLMQKGFIVISQKLRATTRVNPWASLPNNKKTASLLYLLGAQCKSYRSAVGTQNAKGIFLIIAKQERRPSTQ